MALKLEWIANACFFRGSKVHILMQFVFHSTRPHFQVKSGKKWSTNKQTKAKQKNEITKTWDVFRSWREPRKNFFPVWDRFFRGLAVFENRDVLSKSEAKMIFDRILNQKWKKLQKEILSRHWWRKILDWGEVRWLYIFFVVVTSQ